MKRRQFICLFAAVLCAHRAPVKVPPTMSASEANAKYGDAYFVDWEYSK